MKNTDCHLLWLKLHPKSVFVVQFWMNFHIFVFFIEPYRNHRTPERKNPKNGTFPFNDVVLRKMFITGHNPPRKFNISLSLSKEFLGQIGYEVAICTSTSTKHLTSTTVGIPVTLQHLPFGPKRPLNHSRLIFKRMTNLK